VCVVSTQLYSQECNAIEQQSSKQNKSNRKETNRSQSVGRRRRLLVSFDSSRIVQRVSNLKTNCILAQDCVLAYFVLSDSLVVIRNSKIVLVLNFVNMSTYVWDWAQPCYSSIYQYLFIF